MTLALAVGVFKGAEEVTLLEQFLWGLIGSVGFEIVRANTSIWNSQRKSRLIPRIYSNPVFWCFRLLLALVAGAVAVAQGAETRILALEIGIAAPLLIEAFSRSKSQPDLERE
jgi:hypothetical protein